ncbi:MAG: hypothetical protein ABJA10_02765 [Aestuariivirga sp.]
MGSNILITLNVIASAWHLFLVSKQEKQSWLPIYALSMGAILAADAAALAWRVV